MGSSPILVSISHPHNTVTPDFNGFLINFIQAKENISELHEKILAPLICNYLIINIINIT